MKSLRMLGLLAAWAVFAALLPGTASATELRNSVEMLAAGSTVSAEAEGALALNGPFGGIECTGSSLSGKTSNTGGSTETVKVTVETLTFTGCSSPVTVLAKGTLEIHTKEGSGNGNGALTSTSTEVTAEKFGLHCIYKTSATTLGTITGSVNTGKTATYDIAASLPRTGGKSGAFCGSTGEIKGSYKVTTPDALNVDTGSVPAATSLSTSLSGESKSGEEITVNEGSKVKDTATLSGEKASKATGTVKYKVYADKECKELVTSAGEVTVTAGSVPASEEKTLEAGRVYYWQAEYSGDSENAASKSTCGKEVLTVKAATSLSTSLSGESKSGEELSVAEGAKVKDTATLSGTRASAATGKVKFKAYKDKECKELASEAGEGSLSEGKASSEEKTLEVGTYYWQAEYAGDSLHQASTGTCGKEVLTVKYATSLSTSLVGEPSEEEAELVEGKEISVLNKAVVADTAKLSGTSSSTATGKVKYEVYKDKECKELETAAGEVSVEKGEVPPSDNLDLEEGTFYWQASYEGDAQHAPTTSACDEVLHVVAPTSLTPTLVGEGETGEDVKVSEEAVVTDTVALSGPNAKEATGKVQYTVYSDEECTEAVAEAGEVTVSEGKVPASSGETLEPGIYYWTAVYSGDSHNQASESECGSAAEIILPPVTTTLSGGGSSGEEIEVEEGTAVTDQATLHGENASEATGGVKYFVYADEKCEELVASAGEAKVEGASVPASSSVKLEEVGTYFWQAEYSGDENNPPATTPCGVGAAIVTSPASLTVTLSGGGEEGAEIEVEEGTAVSAQTSLSGAEAAAAEGTASYTVYENETCTEIADIAGVAEVEAGAPEPSGEVVLAPGTYYWQVEYSGDGVNAPASSTCGSVVEVVTTPITAALSGEGHSAEDLVVSEGASVTAEATLHGEHAAEATGTVKYLVYSDESCESLLKTAGEVKVEGPSVPPSTSVEFKEPGDYHWRVEYSGDAKNPPALSPCGPLELEVAHNVPQYAALGDSFSAGQGVHHTGGSYYPSTDTWGTPFVHRKNVCHRSAQAWPALIWEAITGNNAEVTPPQVMHRSPPFIFRACTSARIPNVWSGPGGERGGQWDEEITGAAPWWETPAQATWLQNPPPNPKEPWLANPDIQRVSMTIGGNDAGFSKIAAACFTHGIVRLWRYSPAFCQYTIAGWEAPGCTALQANLPIMLKQISVSAPNAGIIVFLYPHILNLDIPQIPVGLYDFLVVNNESRLDGITAARALDNFLWKLNWTIINTVNKVRSEGFGRVHVAADTADAMTFFGPHRLGDPVPWMNGLIVSQHLKESFHPNTCGHRAVANRARPWIDRFAPNIAPCP